tara:strand:+ start:4865 stop:5941 length:1077 start_codon:yes stop_codon:yes gene_type:complete
MELNKEFWHDKKVFITGHTGFKGSWLSLWLHQLGAKVYGYSLEPPARPNLYEALTLDANIEGVIGDIRTYDFLNQSISDVNPEILIHMAAQPLVRDSYLDPRYTYETNIMGTVNTLDIAKKNKTIKSVLVITSDKCYHNAEKNYHYKESDSLGGHDPYSSSKGCADIVASAFYNSFFLKNNVGVAIARAGNVIGGGDWSKDRIIPDAIRSFSKNEKLEIRNPDSVRPWQFVLDPLYGYLLLIEKLSINPKSYSGPWNFGPKEETAQSVELICNKITALWKNGASWTLKGNNELHEANLLLLNSDKANEQLRWQSKYDLNTTLEKTIKWYINFYSEEKNVKDFTINQINEYEKNGNKKK